MIVVFITIKSVRLVAKSRTPKTEQVIIFTSGEAERLMNSQKKLSNRNMK